MAGWQPVETPSGESREAAEMEGIMVEVKPGMTMWSDVLGANVEVLRVHKSTATVRVWGRGLAEGKLMTFRGQRLDSLRPKR